MSRVKKRGNLVFRFPAGRKEDIFPPVLFSPYTCGIVCCRGDFSSSFRLRMWWLLDFDSPFPSMKTAAVKRLQSRIGERRVSQFQPPSFHFHTTYRFPEDGKREKMGLDLLLGRRVRPRATDCWINKLVKGDRPQSGEEFSNSDLCHPRLLRISRIFEAKIFLNCPTIAIRDEKCRTTVLRKYSQLSGSRNCGHKTP